MNSLQKKILKAVEWRRQQVEAGNKWVFYGGPLLAVMIIVLIVWAIARWANANSGFVTALSVFLSVPLAVITANKLEHRRLTKKVNIALHVLVHELWCNLNYVRQIEVSYRRNLKRIATPETEGGPAVGFPMYGPRLSVFEKFIGEEHIFNLNYPLPLTLTEIYAQLFELREEFFRWKEVTYQMSYNDPEAYSLVSQTILSYIEPTMRNMVSAWVSIVSEVGEHSSFPQVVESAKLINSHAQLGGDIATAYKASWLVANHAPMSAEDVIICWENDWPEAPVKVIELKAIAAIHPSWVKS